VPDRSCARPSLNQALQPPAFEINLEVPRVLFRAVAAKAVRFTTSFAGNGLVRVWREEAGVSVAMLAK
jgi:hypothetical protein